jgi:transcriptional regulator with XRE-family HTH domain
MGSIGENIKQLRIERGMSQEQLAQAIGKSRSAISQYETDVNMPRMGVIEDLASVFLVEKLAILGDGYKSKELSYEERQLIDLYRNMDDSHRSTLLETARAFSALSEKDEAVSERVIEPRAMDAVR